MSGEREQSWSVGRVAWFTRHVREGIGVIAGQLGRLLPAPGQLDNAAVAGIIGVRRDQAGGLVLYPGQAGSWSAVPGFTAAGQLKPVTIATLLARSGLRPGSTA